MGLPLYLNKSEVAVDGGGTSTGWTNTQSRIGLALPPEFSALQVLGCGGLHRVLRLTGVAAEAAEDKQDVASYWTTSGCPNTHICLSVLIASL